jgi:hypothetical protein
MGYENPTNGGAQSACTGQSAQFLHMSFSFEIIKGNQ